MDNINMDKIERMEEVILSLTDAEDILKGIYHYYGLDSWAEFVEWYYESEL